MVNNTAGSIAGGSVGNSSPAVLTIDGSYQSSGTGTLVALLEGVAAGQVSAVNVTGGDISLQGGILQVDAINGLSLSSGQTFDNVLAFAPGELQGLFSELEVGSKTGNGTTVNLGNNLTLGALYNVAAGNVTLEVVTTPQTTADNWIGGSTGNWSTSGDWSVRVPTFFSDVTIDNASVTLSQDATITA